MEYFAEGEFIRFTCPELYKPRSPEHIKFVIDEYCKINNLVDGFDYIYGLICVNDKYYIGWTKSPEKRFTDHFNQTSEAAKFTQSHRPVGILFCVRVPNNHLVYVNDVRGGSYTQETVGLYKDLDTRPLTKYNLDDIVIKVRDILTLWRSFRRPNKPDSTTIN